jgi:predicted Rdx family selenoprotein
VGEQSDWAQRTGGGCETRRERESWHWASTDDCICERGHADVGHQLIEALTNQLSVHVITDNGGTATVKSRDDVYNWLRHQARDHPFPQLKQLVRLSITPPRTCLATCVLRAT